MHEHRISFQQKPTQKFWQNHKKPKIFPKKIENLGKNNACMHEEKGKEEIENTYQVREAWIRLKMWWEKLF